MRLIFEYSYDYDQMLSINKKIDPRKTKEYILNFETEWKDKEKKILNAIEKASRLKFKKPITCFIVQNMPYLALSHPLTITTKEDVEKNIHLLIHELIHIILVQNQTKKIIQKLEEVYPIHEEMVHLPVLLIQKRVEEMLYGKGSFEKNIDGLEAFIPSISRIYPDYLRQRSDIFTFLLK